MSEMKQMNEISEKMQSAFEEMKSTLEAQETETGTKLAQSVFDEKMVKMHEDIEAKEEQWNEKFADLEAKYNAPETATSGVEEEATEAEIQKSAFDTTSARAWKVLTPPYGRRHSRRHYRQPQGQSLPGKGDS